MNLPKQINPCPIYEAVVEIRFNSSLPSDAVFGVVYNQLKDSYQNNEQLPILQIPELVRNNDPNLKFQPYYKLKRDNYVIQIGPHVLSLSITDNSYTTWEDYFSEIQNVFGRVGELNFISNVMRVGLRYINFFEDDVWEKINLSVKIVEDEITDNEVFVRTVIPKEDFKVLLQVGNQFELTRNNQTASKVSVIDIDTSIEGDNVDFFENTESLLNKGHKLEKEIFFKLLKEEFLASLNPQY